MFLDAIFKISALKPKLALYSENYDNSHFENFKKGDMPENFKIEFYLVIIDFIIDNFSQRFYKESMLLFYLALQFIINPISFLLDFLLLLSGSFFY